MLFCLDVIAFVDWRSLDYSVDQIVKILGTYRVLLVCFVLYSHECVWVVYKDSSGCSAVFSLQAAWSLYFQVLIILRDGPGKLVMIFDGFWVINVKQKKEKLSKILELEELE